MKHKIPREIEREKKINYELEKRMTIIANEKNLVPEMINILEIIYIFLDLKYFKTKKKNLFFRKC